MKQLQVLLAAFTAVVLLTVLVPAAAFAGAEEGRKLFTGEVKFSAGGAACISCHSVGATGSLGGGSLGPTLTGKQDLLMAAWINGGGSPVMSQIYATRQVTEGEVEDLKAFVTSVGAQPEQSSGKFIGISIVVAIGLLIIFAIGWGDRYRNRNSGTAHDALWRNYGGKGGK